MIRRDRTKVKPYDKIEPKSSGSQGLMGRLRRIFSRSPQPSRDNTVADVSNLSNVSNLSVLSDANPNKTLSEFFKSKGDAPLNDIEVEGVLSLINKVHQQNQSQLETYRQSQTESQFLSSSGLKPNESSFFGNSTILRPASVKPTAKVDVPTYTPKEDKITRHPQPFPTTIKKRVVQYSSLPSPYRMRLETPVKPRVEKRQIRSRTANKVLSIIENPEALEEEDKVLDEQTTPGAKFKPNSSNAEQKQLPKENKVLKEEPEIIEIDSEDDVPEQKSEPKPEAVKPVQPVQIVQPQKPEENKLAADAPSTALPPITASQGAEPVEQYKAKIEELPQDTPVEPAVVSKPEAVPEELQKPKFTFRPAEAQPFAPNVPPKPSSLEIIEKFTFPEVETPSSPETPFLPLPQPTVIDHFSFPDVEMLDPEALNSINPEAVKLYSSVFTF
ncbi:hypothetical protein KL918_003660 [Ogataea parapolymorpha]|uniref:Uncharacterized protein n=1 Tax=Ogataea parapolymorpha (strain ATCC 26012 / BCRC 20466 / JCM 22074 / NRRL Y-7560 / DL-1) TaxID=871575 RepID=W1QJW0_OGAPD|nr:hypothetical protein HPODL_04877 [Ogataea parapolymorpha DL-1]ESX02117.1 hypothetical protein HPODL_04877 [Ogataea parapolymorpha DL-1]KAG7866195.1 hypothetical protein KL918_003660 [Ogataea parapolymorpha]KAG7871328.1 hypothetical protein KL916_004123 [Ogataea parapolymorpha]